MPLFLTQENAGGVRGGLAICRTMLLDVFAHVAQSAEHFLGKEEVSGSIPLMGSIVR